MVNRTWNTFTGDRKYCIFFFSLTVHVRPQGSGLGHRQSNDLRHFSCFFSISYFLEIASLFFSCYLQLFSLAGTPFAVVPRVRILLLSTAKKKKKVELSQNPRILSILFQALYLTKLPPLLELFVIPLVIEQHPVCLHTLQLHDLEKSSWVSWNSFVTETTPKPSCTSHLFN